MASSKGWCWGLFHQLVFLWGTFPSALLHDNVARRGSARWKVPVGGSSAIWVIRNGDASSTFCFLLKTSPELVFLSFEGATSATTFSFWSLVEGAGSVFFCLAKAARFFLFWASNILPAWERKQRRNQQTHTCKIALAGVKGRGIPMYALRHVALYSCFISLVVLNTTWRLERKSHTSRSRGGKSSRHMDFLSLRVCVQYKGNSSKRLWSLALQRILKNLPLKPLYDCWKRVSKTLPATPLKLTHSFRPGFWLWRNKGVHPLTADGRSSGTK